MMLVRSRRVAFFCTHNAMFYWGEYVRGPRWRYRWTFQVYNFFPALPLFNIPPLYLRKLIECVCVGLTQKNNTKFLRKRRCKIMAFFNKTLLYDFSLQKLNAMLFSRICCYTDKKRNSNNFSDHPWIFWEIRLKDFMMRSFWFMRF